MASGKRKKLKRKTIGKKRAEAKKRYHFYSPQRKKKRRVAKGRGEGRRPTRQPRRGPYQSKEQTCLPCFQTGVEQDDCRDSSRQEVGQGGEKKESRREWKSQ